jgi:hypothetical protein
MLFFRSEESLRIWCAARGVPQGPAMTLEQLWNLSRVWFANRLSPDGRRPTVAEVRRMFASIGLTGSFWDPEAT